MKITRDQLKSGDFSTLFTRSPGTFFEGVLVNILWNGSGPISKAMHDAIDRQKYIFLKWHEYFSINLRYEITQELAALEHAKIAGAYDKGHHAGRIEALSNLPVKSNMLGKSVDLNAVTELLRKLKAEEPIGVSTHEQATNRNQ